MIVEVDDWLALCVLIDGSEERHLDDLLFLWTRRVADHAKGCSRARTASKLIKHPLTPTLHQAKLITV